MKMTDNSVCDNSDNFQTSLNERPFIDDFIKDVYQYKKKDPNIFH